MGFEKTSSTQVLLIEDNQADAALVKNLLEQESGQDFWVHGASRLEEGLQCLKSLGAGAVLLDLGLPDTVGLDGVARILAQVPLMPVVILTGREEEELGVQALRQGAQDYLIKGQLTGPLLIRSLKYAIERGRTERRFNQELEERVRERTRALELANKELTREILERKRVEDSLRESEKQFRDLFEGSPDAIFVEDFRGQVLDVNPAACRLHGLAREELIGTNVFDLVPPGYRSQAERDFALFVSGEASLVQGFSLARNQRKVPVELRVSQISYRGYPALLLHVRDISERRQAEEERRKWEERLLQTQKLESLGVLAGGIAHDFNNLLTGILGNASLALRDFPQDHPSRYAVGQIETIALRASDLTKQLLAYAGKGRLVIRPIHLSSLASEMAELLKTVISRKARLEFDFPSNLPMIEGDVTQIRQVVMNLITNASDALGDQEGVITLRTGEIRADQEFLASTFLKEDLPEGFYVYLEVSDSGRGMDAETQVRIFDPFFTTKFTGRGLGLAAVLGIVRGHRGAIQVSSQPGQGSTFRVLFASKGSGQPAPIEPSTKPSSSLGSGLILIVEDEESVRDILQRILVPKGFRLVMARDGQEGLEAFRSHDQYFDAVVLDLTMPRLGGAEVFAALRQLRPRLPVVIISGHGEQEVAHLLAGNVGATFVPKPFLPEDLLAALKSVLHPKS